MSARKRPIGGSDALELGQAVLRARHAGAQWKMLERVYDRSRQQLWRCARAAEKAAHATSLALRRAT